MSYLADALYEATNGGMLLGTVTFYTDGTHATDANVVWQAGGSGSRCRPMSQVSDYGLTGMRIAFCDVSDCIAGGGPSCDTEDYLSHDVAQQDGGYTLAHKMGHYLLGLYDEHAGSAADAPFWQPRLGDVPVAGCIMNQQWRAILGGGYIGDFSYLNFSTSLNNNADTNAQHRVYDASAWETLIRPASLDPRDGERAGLPPRVGYRVLAPYAPATGQAPTIELPAQRLLARSALSFAWDALAPSTADSLHAEATQGQFAAVVNPYGSGPFYPGQTVTLYALATREVALITGATVTGDAVDPSGAHFAVAFADDGVAPDRLAGDGIYTATLTAPAGRLLLGTYSVSVTFSSSGADVFTYASYDTTAAPVGSEVVIPDVPVGTSFYLDATVNVTVAQDGVFLPLAAALTPLHAQP